MVFAVHTRQLVEMGHKSVHQIETDGARQNAQHGHGQAGLSPAVFHRGQNQPQNGGGQHNAGGKGQNDIAEFVGEFFKDQAQNGAHHGSAPHAQSGDPYHRHKKDAS